MPVPEGFGRGGGCIRRGGGGGGVLKVGGRGFWLGLPSSQGPPMVPAEGGPRLTPLGAKGAEAKFWLSASNIGRGGGGGPPPPCANPPPSYGVRPF